YVPKLEYLNMFLNTLNDKLNLNMEKAIKAVRKMVMSFKLAALKEEKYERTSHQSRNLVVINLARENNEHYFKNNGVIVREAFYESRRIIYSFEQNILLLQIIILSDTTNVSPTIKCNRTTARAAVQ
ncbi:hypothetical protein L9F63_002873, partial [Diploptera punctata]